MAFKENCNNPEKKSKNEMKINGIIIVYYKGKKQ